MFSGSSQWKQNHHIFSYDYSFKNDDDFTRAAHISGWDIIMISKSWKPSLCLSLLFYIISIVPVPHYSVLLFFAKACFPSPCALFLSVCFRNTSPSFHNHVCISLSLSPSSPNLPFLSYVPFFSLSFFLSLSLKSNQTVTCLNCSTTNTCRNESPHDIAVLINSLWLITCTQWELHMAHSLLFIHPASMWLNCARASQSATLSWLLATQKKENKSDTFLILRCFVNNGSKMEKCDANLCCTIVAIKIHTSIYHLVYNPADQPCVHIIPILL